MGAARNPRYHRDLDLRDAGTDSMTYRVYLRWADQRVSDKTVTEDRALAELAYKTLIARPDLAGKPVGVAFTERVGGQPRQIAYHACDEAPAKTSPTSGSTLHIDKTRR